YRAPNTASYPFELEQVLKYTRNRRKLIPAARHVQVGTSVPVCIEEHGSPVFVLLVGGPGLPLGGLDEAAVPPLEEQLARDPRGTADEHIVQAVAVHICHRDGRAVEGQLVRRQGLHLVVGERPRLVPIL